MDRHGQSRHFPLESSLIPSYLSLGTASPSKQIDSAEGPENAFILGPRPFTDDSNRDTPRQDIPSPTRKELSRFLKNRPFRSSQRAVTRWPAT